MCVSGASQVLSLCCLVRLSNHRLEPGRPGLQGLTLGLTCGMLTVAHAAWQPEEAAAPCAPARRWRMRACCGRACAAFTARLKHAARRSSTAEARQRSCQQTAKPLQSALMPLVEVVVGLVAARGVGGTDQHGGPLGQRPKAPLPHRAVGHYQPRGGPAIRAPAAPRSFRYSCQAHLSLRFRLAPSALPGVAHLATATHG